MDDDPITPTELAELKRLRKGKPPSKALPKDRYRNVEFTIKYQSEKTSKKQNDKDRKKL